jgi:long-chain acyl-CoA synthetase
VSAEGEVLALGAHVPAGYYKDPEQTASAFTEGWCKTGDLGELRDGWLLLRGRKKDMIVPAHGVNVYAEDVEAAVLKIPRVRDVAVIGRTGASGEEVHAVLLLHPDAPPPGDIVREANTHLDTTQQIASFTLWPYEDFPRTATLKVRKFLVTQEVKRESARERPREETAPTKHSRLLALIATATNRSPTEVSPEAVLAQDLGLDSVGRLELVSLLETELAVDIEESDITADTTVADLENLIARTSKMRERFFWRWPFHPLLSFLQRVLRHIVAFPLLRVWVQVEARGTEHLKGLQGPVLFVSNHVSAIDTLIILRALPSLLRRQVAVFARLDLFEHRAFFRALVWRIWFFVFSLFLPVVVVPQNRGFRRTLAFAGRAGDCGWSFIFFPEGQRTDDGKMRPFRTGAGLTAQELLVPVVPMHLRGLTELLPKGSKWPRRGHVVVTFGKPFSVAPVSPIESTQQLQRAVAALR